MSTTTKHLHALPFWEHLNNAEKDMLRNNAYIRTFDRDSYTFIPWRARTSVL